MKIVCASWTIYFNSRHFSKSFSFISCLSYCYWITFVNAYNLLTFAVWSYMMQERRNEKIGILILFVIDQRDLAGGKAACVSRRCIWGSLGRNQCALVAGAARIFCIWLSEGDLAFYQTHACSTALSSWAHQWAWMLLRPSCGLCCQMHVGPYNKGCLHRYHQHDLHLLQAWGLRAD